MLDDEREGARNADESASCGVNGDRRGIASSDVTTWPSLAATTAVVPRTDARVEDDVAGVRR